MILSRIGIVALSLSTVIAVLVVVASFAAAQAGDSAAEESGQVDGAAIYTSTCVACHQGDGQGVPGAFPPLAGHIGDLYAAEGGPQYIASVVLFGLQGPITVDGETYNGVMPSFYQYSDQEIAAVIDHVMTAWGDSEELPGEYVPLTAEDVATARGLALSPQLVHDRRPNLEGESDQGEDTDLVEATYTTAQVERIRATYDRLCQECHGTDLTGGLIGGPPLAGFGFRQKWGGRPLAPLYLFTSTQMPQGSPGSLSPQQYADLIALMLSHNGHEAGDEPLTPDIDRLREQMVRPN